MAALPWPKTIDPKELTLMSFTVQGLYYCTTLAEIQDLENVFLRKPTPYNQFAVNPLQYTAANEQAAMLSVTQLFKQHWLPNLQRDDLIQHFATVLAGDKSTEAYVILWFGHLDIVQRNRAGRSAKQLAICKQIEYIFDHT